MKVILTTSVDNLGGPGEQITVATGYARNYLIPRGLAVEATRANLNLWKDRIARLEEKEQREIEEARKLAATIDGRELTFVARAGAKGRLFGSITSGDIAERLDVDRKQLVLGEPIKSLGSSAVQVKLHPRVSATVTVNVVAEEAGEEAAEEE